jgi:hypothetical protein
MALIYKDIKCAICDRAISEIWLENHSSDNI